MRHFDSGACIGCKHFESAFADRDTGYSQEQHCNVPAELYGKGDCSEGVSLLLESILFQLSDLNNCPMRQEARRSITELRSQAA